MPHQSETTRKASPGSSRPSRKAGAGAPDNSKIRRGASPPDIQSMQQTYGNHAVERMVLAARAKLDAARAAEGMKGPYAAMAARIEAAATREGRLDLLEPFAALTPPQRMAAMRSMGSGGGEARQAQGDFDWKRLAAAIRAVEGVRLEEREIDVEAAVGEPGTDEAAGPAADLTGLLAPYRDIARWLHYKADKQGKAEQMRLFRTLSIPQQKIALHRMAEKRKLDFKAFAEAMTVTIELKQWVDWDAFAAAVRAAGRIRIEAGADPLDYVSFEGESGKEDETEEDDGLDLGALLGGAAGLLGLGAEQDEDERAERQQDSPAAGNAEALRARLAAPGQLGWLLLGLAAGIDGAAAVAAYLQRRADREAVVDRFLGLPADSAGRARTRLRGKLLREQGFAGVEQCYAHLLREVASIIVERGTKDADPAYAKLLGDMGWPPAAGRLPTPDMVLKKLTAAG